MKVTVRDCLQLDVFRQSVVVAGEKNLDNRIKNISVMDAGSAAEAAKYSARREELILTAFSAMRNDTDEQCDTVKALARGGIAGLVVFQREAAADNHNYKEVIDAAEEAGLPLVILVNGRDIDYSDVIAEVMENLLYGNNFKNSLINNTIFHLLNFEKHSSFQQALRAVSYTHLRAHETR